ncbi:ribosome quality control complex subunit NEMF-like [Hydractinia symbiolongicarpus]|uniref:ribosome quality control complex subunit NEMF-like n=1 Tax=Hydractinia symbiolongicarpus TaxID=13093 RepID=UPI00254BD028|nr:ribosome quality control complex subunit NEMF-like [Hydractinia symbiolongicarpus]
MKSRFTTIDLKSIITEIQNSNAMGLRVFNVYDIDNKTYLLRLTHGDTKVMLLIESGNRVHLTEYDWPKNMMPSGFSMKCRKHLKGRRLASVSQVGIDRIVDFTFGYEEAAYHLIVELYDRGNIILTDYEYRILQLLRNRTDVDKDVKFAVREAYPIDLARKHEALLSKERLKEILHQSKPGENLKRVLNPLFVYGPAVLEHCLLETGLQPSIKLGQKFNIDNDDDMNKLMTALENAENILYDKQVASGYIIQKKEVRLKSNNITDESGDDLLTYVEFHPFLFTQHQHLPHKELESFNKCVDEFFSKLEGQKFEIKALQIEKAAIKRLENVKLDHENRIKSLQDSQDADMKKAELIEINLPLVERAIATINSALANQIGWEEIEEIVQEAKSQSDPVANVIKKLKLDTNQLVLSLTEPFMDVTSENEEQDDKENKRTNTNRPVDVLIDLSLTAFANARSLHNKRRHAASKEQKTLQASKKALKSAEQKTKETLKEVQTSKLISKTRKTYWFEKFYWFISSENYLVIGGRDQQQNELIVKRYLKPGDLYVHADLHGASSVILKNPGGGEVPPKTLNEAGTMAISYSAAWDARVVTSAWWVYHNQVSKTAPSGEYLTTGSFMIRGKKNYLPPSYLIMGFSVLFKLDESSIDTHKNDRKVRQVDDDTKVELDENEENEISLEDDDEEEQSEVVNLLNRPVLSPVTENGVLLNDAQEAASGGVRVEDFELKTEEEEMKERGDTEKDDEEENYEKLFPDTNIQLQHVSGDQYQLHRGISNTSNVSSLDGGNEIKDEEFIYFGDGEKLRVTRQDPQTGKVRLSAKQKRDLKKKNKKVVMENVKEDESENMQDPTEKVNNSGDSNNTKKKQQQQQLQPEQRKRGQKSKQKKMKEKYKYQDDEDKELMQQILRSHEPGKKKEKQKQVNKKQPIKQQLKIAAPTVNAPNILHQPDDQPLNEKNKNEAEDEKDDIVEEFDKEHTTILDSLTGCPVEDDVLLYAIPLCAPYTCMTNYKYKAKLTPGSGKRGKAAKTALNMFMMSKDSKDWEKDLLKCLKDVDISRNIPGKVKVSAPNIQKVRKK